MRTNESLLRNRDSLTVETQIEGGMVKKQYIARVIGAFPEDEVGHSCGDTLVKGKAACTKFTRISTNGTHSIVLCEPITGRTHQLRVHLQYTGHPIANDMLYLFDHAADRSTERMSADRAAANSGHTKTFCSDGFEYSSKDFSIDPMCTNCPNLAPKGYDDHDEALWLHCIRYSGPGWTYECPYPVWASLG